MLAYSLKYFISRYPIISTTKFASLYVLLWSLCILSVGYDITEQKEFHTTTFKTLLLLSCFTLSRTRWKFLAPQSSVAYTVVSRKHFLHNPDLMR